MGLTDTKTIYTNWSIGLLIAFSVIAIIIGIYYFIRYSNNKTNTTILWAVGFLVVGLGVLLNSFTKLFLADFFTDRGINHTKLFSSTAVLILVGALTLSTFTLGLFKEKAELIGLISSSVFTVIGIILVVLNGIWFDQLDFVARMPIWLLSLWIMFFFSFLSFKSEDFRLLVVTLGIILIAVSGFVSASYKDSLLGLLGIIGELIAISLIAFGLFITGREEEEEMEEPELEQEEVIAEEGEEEEEEISF
ncbi:MAG: hypothetical protein GF308_19725 [Candidatus Heimdallarchaeota archaeon]|nr:hypothetical protein [Candidatus Heimdallarchaeota archaeon]